MIQEAEPTRVSMARKTVAIIIYFSVWTMDEVTGHYNPRQYRMETRVDRHHMEHFKDGLIMANELADPCVTSFAKQMACGLPHVLSIDNIYESI
jgi:hypothetical protein